MFVLGLLLALSTVSAQMVSGIGRLSSDSRDDAQFSLGVFESAVRGIVLSMNNGPNRTVPQSLPVEKIYGVNVGVRRTGLAMLLNVRRIQIGNWLVSEPWLVLLRFMCVTSMRPSSFIG